MRTSDPGTGALARALFHHLAVAAGNSLFDLIDYADRAGHPAPAIVAYAARRVRKDGAAILGEWDMTTLSIDEIGYFTVARQLDRGGNDARLDGPLSWTLEPPELGTAEVLDADGRSVRYTTADNAAGLEGFLIGEGDADQGEGVRPVRIAIPILVKSGEVVTIEAALDRTERKA